MRQLFDTLLLAASDRAYVSSAAMRERGKLYRFWALTPAMYRAFNASFVNALAATALAPDADAAAQLQSWLGVLDSLTNAFVAMAGDAGTKDKDKDNSSKDSGAKALSTSGASLPGAAPAPAPVPVSEEARRGEALRVCQSVLGSAETLAKLSAAFFAVRPRYGALAELFDEVLAASAWRRVDTLRRVLELVALTCTQPLSTLAAQPFRDRGTVARHCPHLARTHSESL